MRSCHAPGSSKAAMRNVQDAATMIGVEGRGQMAETYWVATRSISGSSQ